MLLGKKIRTMWDFLFPTGSGDWLLYSGRILRLDQQWWVGKTTQVNSKDNKTNPAYTKGRESSTKCLHPRSTTSCSPGSFSILDLRVGNLSTALTCSFANVTVTFGLCWYELLAC